MKKLLLILNPTSGTRKAAKNLTEIISVFNRADYDTHVYITACRGDAVKAVQQLSGDADLIVCCGGDGTLNETVTGVIEARLDVPIGYIPSGSTNDFANSLHLSGDVVEAAQQIVSGTPTVYDVGKFGDRYFTYIASFGVFTKASYTTPQNIKIPSDTWRMYWKEYRNCQAFARNISAWSWTEKSSKMTTFSAQSATPPVWAAF